MHAESDISDTERPESPDGEPGQQRSAWAAVLVGLPATLLIIAVRAYQICLSPLLGRNCRFHPTCSRYFIESVQKYGAVKGSWRGFRRLSRCHPWNPGGNDPP